MLILHLPNFPILNSNFSVLDPIKISKIYRMSHMKLWPNMVPLLIVSTNRNQILCYYPNARGLFNYIRQYHSSPSRQYHPTSSLLNNPDTDSHQDNLSQISDFNQNKLLDPFNSNFSFEVFFTLPKYFPLIYSISQPP